MDQWLKENLVCPRDLQALDNIGEELHCRQGHTYPIVDGIPVMLLDDVSHTHEVAARETFAMVAKHRQLAAPPGGDRDRHSDQTYTLERAVHPYVNEIVACTCGQLYKPLVGKLQRYPIPEIELPPGSGEILLDIGCGWGRWSIAAARRGYTPVGIDPKLEAIRAARDIARQLEVAAIYLVGDVRYLPFKSNRFPTLHAFGVLQHFSKENVRSALDSIARVLQVEGLSLIQMPNLYGLRNLSNHIVKRKCRDGKNFDVRYWTVPELKKLFETTIGASSFSVAGYFGLGIQKADRDLLPRRYRMLVDASEAIRAASLKAPWLKYLADSVYVRSRREDRDVEP